VTRTCEANDPLDGTYPLLTRSDAWLLAALTERSHDGHSVNLRDLVHDADWLNRAIPTYDEISFGLPRLVAAGSNRKTTTSPRRSTAPGSNVGRNRSSPLPTRSRGGRTVSPDGAIGAGLTAGCAAGGRTSSGGLLPDLYNVGGRP
jgi:hypothetical protein